MWRDGRVETLVEGQEFEPSDDAVVLADDDPAEPDGGPPAGTSPRPADVLSWPSWDTAVDGDGFVVSLLPESVAAGFDLERFAKNLSDHSLRLLQVLDPDGNSTELVVPWAGAADGGRARPFLVFLHADRGGYVVTVPGVGSVELTPAGMADLLLAHRHFRALAGGPARRPMVLLTLGDGDGALDEELLRVLVERDGVRQVHRYHGMLAQHESRSDVLRIADPAGLSQGALSVTGHARHTAVGGVFAFSVPEGVHVRHAGVVAALLGGARVVGPWGSREPVVVALPTTERYGTVFGLDDRPAEFDGASFARSLMEDEGFRAALRSRSGPVVLVGSDSGSRRGIGGFGFDFAGVLRSEGDFRDVYAVAGDVVVGPEGVSAGPGSRFELVSMLRAGDLRMGLLRGADGKVVGLLVRSEGDEQTYQDLRSWAAGVTPETLSHFLRTTDGTEQHSPWPHDTTPVMLFFTKRTFGNAIRGLHVDGTSLRLPLRNLGAVLRDDLLFRDVAGIESHVPLLLASLDAGGVDAVAFAEALAPGGYHRRVHHPEGVLRFEPDGRLRLDGGGFATVEPPAIRPADVVTHPLTDPATGRSAGQSFPGRSFDAARAEVYWRREVTAAHHTRTVVEPALKGGSTKHHVQVPKPWADQEALPWFVHVFTEPNGAWFRMTTGDPYRSGDAVLLGTGPTTEVVLDNPLLRAAGTPVAGVVLSHDPAPQVARAVREGLRVRAGEDVRVWAEITRQTWYPTIAPEGVTGTDHVEVRTPGVLFFPRSPNSSDLTRWPYLLGRMPLPPDGLDPVHVFAHADSTAFFTEDRRYDGTAFADEVGRSDVYNEADPHAPLLLVVHLRGASLAHLDVAREFAEALRGSGPYREVLVNTAPLRTGHHTGGADMNAAKFVRVSVVRPTDLHLLKLRDAHGGEHGVAFLPDTANYRALRRSTKALANDYTGRVVRVLNRGVDQDAHLVPVDWASSYTGTRARPFTVSLQSQGDRYAGRLRDGRLIELSASELAPVLLAIRAYRRPAVNGARRPAVLLTRADPANRELNEELLRLLNADGMRPSWQYSGGASFHPEVVGNFGIVGHTTLLPSGGRLFSAGPEVRRADVALTWEGQVFRLAAPEDVPTAVGGVVDRLSEGGWPWGGVRPVGLVLASAEGYAVVPTVDSGRVEASGDHVARLALEDPGVAELLDAVPDRPVVLVGESAGDRRAIGGVGFDFASELHRRGDFRDVYALVGAAGGPPRFELVSGPRTGDVERELVRDAAGKVVAVVVRSPGDDEAVERVRRWALATTPETLSRYRSRIDGDEREEQAPWPARRPPLLLFTTRSESGAHRTRRGDGRAVSLSSADLAAALRDDQDVRDAAGHYREVGFVLASLDGVSGEPVGFGDAMLPGGYSRMVHWPEGRLLLGDDGTLTVEGGIFKTAPAKEPEPDDLIAEPFVNPSSGHVEGVTFPLDDNDLFGGTVAFDHGIIKGDRHYHKVVRTNNADGSVNDVLVKRRMKWRDSATPPWFIDMHGNSDVVVASMRTGHPHRYGDVVTLSGPRAGHVLTYNRVYLSRPHPAGEQKVATVCHIGAAGPDGTSVASHIREAFEKAEGTRVVLHAATGVVTLSGLTSRMRVTGGGRYQRVPMPGKPFDGPSDDESTSGGSDTERFVSDSDSDSEDFFEESGGVRWEDVASVSLTDVSGARVGVAFLSGGEAGVAVDALGGASGVPGRFSVVVHHGVGGFRVPLRSGGEVVLDRGAFLRLVLTSRVVPVDSTLVLLACDVGDVEGLRVLARGLGHRGDVEVSSGRTRLWRDGRVETLAEGVEPEPSDDAVVLADDDQVEGVVTDSGIGGPSHAQAYDSYGQAGGEPLVMFPASADDPVTGRWRHLHHVLRQASPGPAVHVMAYGRDGWFFVDGQWRDATVFAAGIARSDAYRAAGPHTPLAIVVELSGPDKAMAKAGRRVAEVLRGNGPHRQVSINTGPIHVDHATDEIDLATAWFTHVDRLRPTDVADQVLHDAHGQGYGLALYADTGRYAGLRFAAERATDYSHRMVLSSADVENPQRADHVVQEWAPSTTGDRARPFVLHLESDGESYQVRRRDGHIFPLTAAKMRRLLSEHPFYRTLAGGPVRRPLILITRSPRPNSALNAQLLTLLRQDGLRTTFEYSGPVGSPTHSRNGTVVDVHVPVILSRDLVISRGPGVAREDVVLTRTGAVFHLAPSEKVTDMLRGIADHAAAGGASPLVLVVASAEDHAEVPTKDEGRVESGGGEVARIMLGDRDFVDELRANPGRPVALVGESAGNRVGIGGFGFDFASVLRELGDFREVHALARDDHGRRRFVDVSGLRAGDLDLAFIRDAGGWVVAVVVRSPGDEERVQQVRRWARGTSETAPRSLLFLASRSGDGYLGVRRDGRLMPSLSARRLTEVLRDDQDVRDAAGDTVDLVFVFAALDGATVGAEDFARGMARGGYSRTVGWPDGTLVLREDGTHTVVDGTVRVILPATPEPDDVITHPLMGRTAQVEGQFYVRDWSDLVKMSAEYVIERGDAYAVREVGSNSIAPMGYRKKWRDQAVRSWSIAMHGGPGKGIGRLRTGHPDRFGDRVELDSGNIGHVLTRNRVYLSVPHPAGEHKVATICHFGVPGPDGVSLAAHARQAFERAESATVVLWAADQAMELDVVSGMRAVRAGGRYRRAPLPSLLAEESSNGDGDDPVPGAQPSLPQEEPMPYGPAGAGAAFPPPSSRTAPGGVRVSLAPTTSGAVAVAFPRGEADLARWRALHPRLPAEAGGPARVVLFAHADSGGFLVDGGWHGGARLAAEAWHDPGVRAAGPTAPVLLLVDRPEGHVPAAREFADALRGDGPFREVFVNTGPVVLDPVHGHVDMVRARFVRVALPRTDDLLWTPLHDVHGADRGIAFTVDGEVRATLRASAALSDDHVRRVLASGPPEARRTTTAPWAMTTDGTWARPFEVRLDGEAGAYAVGLRDGRELALSAADGARVVAGHEHYRRLAGGSVRRPLLLVAHTEHDGDAPNREFLAALRELEGPRRSFEYSGPVAVSAHSGVLTTLGRNGFAPGPDPASAPVVLRRHGDVFHLPAPGRGVPDDLARIADAVVRGRWTDPAWGDREPVVVVLTSDRLHADVTPTAGGGALQLDGHETAAVLLRDEGFAALLEADPDRPVVLIGEDAGSRVGIGGVGFDFASALRAARDFRGVHALTRDEDGTTRFADVSGLRAGDIRISLVVNAREHVVAVVVRSPGDEERLDQVGRWAWNSTPSKTAWVRRTDDGEWEESPWSPRFQPLLFLAGRSGDGYAALRSDGLPLELSGTDLAAPLRDHQDLRDVAGDTPAVAFALAALDGETVGAEEFAAGMVPGGYSREVHHPVGRLLLHEDGTLGLDGHFETVERVPPHPDAVLADALLEPGTGRVEGQFFPVTEQDRAVMSIARVLEAKAGRPYYVSTASVPDVDGNPAVADSTHPTPWTGAVPSWFFDMHGGLDGEQEVRLRTGHPHRHGDEVMLGPLTTGRVLTGNRIYLSVRHPAGEAKVATVCYLGRPTRDGRPSAASYLRAAFQKAEHARVALYAVTAEVSVHAHTGLRVVRDGGTYRRVTLPGEVDDAPDDEVPAHVTLPVGVAFPVRP
ncbi:hypothetical protein GCM10018963_64960 [Saccharothrix longispora]